MIFFFKILGGNSCWDEVNPPPPLYETLVTAIKNILHSYLPMYPSPAVSQEDDLPPELALGDEPETQQGLAEAYERPSPDRPGMSLLQDSLLGLQGGGECGRGFREGGLYTGRYP